ncbi:hypothetical protein GQX73_g257 [Xylaria multiplex]|uniref:CFEM domain-containing protein n=1 Tax=Xylaria multiplex TaxID=323545 RepID=A0A7C8J860_9PEZI|nr:hypothetical protein GQX73_g257 [Xylaria multiplex]
MKYAVAALAFVAATVSAQSLSDIPECATPCIDDARTSETSCAADDYQCICSNIDALTAAATSCVLDACGSETALNEVLPAVQSFCEAVSNGGGATSTPVSEPTSESTPAPTSEATSEPTATQTEEPTEVPSTTVAPTFTGGNATATTPVTSLVPTAGAAVAGSIGGFAMMALGALAAF